jgi:hypothetical protein
MEGAREASTGAVFEAIEAVVISANTGALMYVSHFSWCVVCNQKSRPVGLCVPKTLSSHHRPACRANAL